MTKRLHTPAEQTYADIIDRPHHRSQTHPPMSNYDRAAQFSPFAALTGYESAVEETARLTDRRIELTEDEKQCLDYKLRCLLTEKGKDTPVRITYFVPDTRKEGGAYRTVTTRIKDVDSLRRTLILEDKTEIPPEYLFTLEWD